MAVPGRVAWGQPMPEIDLDPAIECWYHSEFPTLTAFVDPSEEIVRSRLYFRCSLYPDYYFVDLEAENGEFKAVAPQAEESCPRVHYYVEALTRDFTSSRTRERVADVTSHTECRRRNPAAAFFPGNDPEIVLGSTVAGSNLAPGFKALGVAGFISATGTAIAAAGSTGGSSTAVIAAVAGGGAAAGVGVLATSANSQQQTAPAAPGPGPTQTAAPPAPPPPPVAPPAPPSAPAEVKACFKLDPQHGVLGVNEPLKIDGRCSQGGNDLLFHYDLGDGRTKEGQAFVTAFYPNPGIYTLTLTVERPASSVASGLRQDEDTFSRTITVEEPAAPLEPDFGVRAIEPDLCLAEFDGSRSQGDIDRYQWELDVNDDFGQGVIRRQGRIVQHGWDYFSNCFNLRGWVIVRLTVEGKDGTTASVRKRVNVLGLAFSSQAASLRTSFSSQILEVDNVHARVVLPDGRAQAVSSGAPTLHHYEGSQGRNAVDATLVGPLSEPALWRFDFTGTSHFVPGSLRLLSGQEVSRDTYSIVVRLEGRSGERVRLEYELKR